MYDHMAIDSQEEAECVVNTDLLLTIKYQQELLLEMIADLYELAQALGPKVGVNLVPASTVRAWQHTRSSSPNPKH